MTTFFLLGTSLFAVVAALLIYTGIKAGVDIDDPDTRQDARRDAIVEVVRSTGHLFAVIATGTIAVANMVLCRVRHARLVKKASGYMEEGALLDAMITSLQAARVCGRGLEAVDAFPWSLPKRLRLRDFLRDGWGIKGREAWAVAEHCRVEIKKGDGVE